MVGESGCGKSTWRARCCAWCRPSAGRVSLLGRELLPLQRRSLRAARRDLQVVFQDPLASLDPRMTVRDIVAEPLESFQPGAVARASHATVAGCSNAWAWKPAHLNRYPA